MNPWPRDTGAMLYQLSYEATDVWSRSIVGSYVPVKEMSVNPFTAKFSQKQISTECPNLILWNFEKQIAPCVSTGSFRLNDHIIGFHPQTQKLESPHKTLLSTLAVKGLTINEINRE